jgi:hypothetical protein
MHQMPDEALDALTAVMLNICSDPYDRMHSMEVRREDPGRRMATLGNDQGFIEFRVDETNRLIHVHGFTWIG